MGGESFDALTWLKCGSLLSAGSGEYHIGIGPFDNVTELTAESATWLFPRSFHDLSQSDLFQAKTDCSVSLKTLLSALAPFSNTNNECHWEPPSFDVFHSQFSRAQQLISVGELKKIVPVVFAHSTFQLSLENLGALILQVLRSEAKGYIFGHWNLKHGQAVLGLSPELLFDVDHENRLSTMALAGTASSAEHDLLSDEKELTEHQLVVDDLVERLSRFGLVSVGETHTWQPSRLRHLRTNIDVKLLSFDFFGLLKAMHPTPALGGVPRGKASELLLEFEKVIPRMQFGAPFARRDQSGSARAIVQIRNLIYQGGRLQLGSGCGLVKQSDVKREWNELENKRKAVQEVFGL